MGIRPLDHPALRAATGDRPAHEPFTRVEALRCGLTDRDLRRLCRDGHLCRPLRGVYVDASRPDSLALRAEALRLVVPAGSFVADRTAAWLHGADTALAPNEHLCVPPVSVFRRPGAGRLRNDLATSGERHVIRRDLTVVHGMPVTTPLRTALDLGRLQRRDTALAGMDAVARVGGMSRAEIQAEVPRFARTRGVVQLRALVPLVDALAQSPGESAMRLRWVDAGLPQPTLQVPVRRPDGRYYYLDLGLPEHRFAAEYDGQAWHSTANQRRQDEMRRTWLREVAGWTILVLTRDQVHGQQVAIDLLAEAWRGHRRARADLLPPA